MSKIIKLYMVKTSDFFTKWTYMVVISTFLLILLGGYVKAIGAGLSCPDWPLCYGKIFPFFDGVDYPYSPWMIFVEWFHRLWAMVVGFMYLYTVVQSYNYRTDIPILFKLGSIGIFLFLIQVILGGLTVTSGLQECVVVFHLGNGVLIIMLEMTIAFIATINSNLILQ